MQKRAIQDLPAEDAKKLASAWRSEGATVEMIPQADNLWTVTGIFPDSQGGGGGANATLSDAGGAVKPPVGDNDKLGALSSKYESSGKPEAIGFDSTGGWSYGQYQFASNRGTIGDFLDFLDQDYPSYAKALRDAGGEAAAKSGSSTFKNAWTELAKDGDFKNAQHQFVQVKYYDVFAKKLKDDIGLDISNRSLALQNVAWSVSVQLGPNNDVFADALKGQDLAKMNDKEIISAVYAERSKVDVYFAHSTDQVKTSLLNRFKEEYSDALTMLG